MAYVLEHDRAGSGETVVLLHAGIADRRMWDAQWEVLGGAYDVVRLDLRGFGQSGQPPEGPWSNHADVAATLDALGITGAHLVGCSLGAGVAVEIALARPDLVASLVLVAPGGELITTMTPQLRAFIDAERAATAADDLDAATDANVRWWVDGPHRDEHAVASEVREAVREMQRHAFEVTADWDDLEKALDPPASERLAEVGVPTLVLVGGLDLDTVRLAADGVVAGVPGAQRVDWPDVAHLPSMERPEDFVALIVDRLRSVTA